MTKLTFATIVLAGITVLSGTALADSSMVGPTYIGDRSANPEQETFAYMVNTESYHLLAFVGPARNIGPVTGDAEETPSRIGPCSPCSETAFGHSSSRASKSHPGHSGGFGLQIGRSGQHAMIRPSPARVRTMPTGQAVVRACENVSRKVRNWVSAREGRCSIGAGAVCC